MALHPKNIPAAPAAIGPYCHAMQVGHLIFCSGQTPLDPDTMHLVGTDIETQTERVLINIGLVLGGLGLSLQDVVKTTVFLKNMEDFEGMNAVYAAMFDGHRPARTTVAVKQNPLDALVEIECIAAIKNEKATDPKKTAHYYSKEALRLQPDVEGAKMWAVALEKTMFTYFEVEPHSRFERHDHESEQITMVLEGALYFEVDGGVIRVGAGEVIALPSFVPHAVFTKDEAVKAVDAWSPVRAAYEKGGKGERGQG